MLFHAQKVFDGLEWGYLSFSDHQRIWFLLIFLFSTSLHFQKPATLPHETGLFLAWVVATPWTVLLIVKLALREYIRLYRPLIGWCKDTCIQFSRRSPRSLSLLNCFAKILRNGLNLQSSEIIPAPDFI